MAKREGEVTRVIKSAAQTLGRGKFSEALRELLHLSEKYPDAGEIRPQIAEVYLRRGQSRIRKGKPQEARQDFERSIDWTPKAEAHVALARTLMSEGHLDRAHQLLNAAIEIDDSFAPAHEAIGMLMIRWQDYGEAARAFEQALGLDYANPTLYRAVWEVYMNLEKPARAHELIMEGTERFPNNDALHAAAGDSFVYARGESDEAVHHWERAVELNPRTFSALAGLAGHAAARGDRDRALALLRRCADVNLERARQVWKDDLAAPLGKFQDFRRDQDFLTVFGWQND